MRTVGQIKYDPDKLLGRGQFGLVFPGTFQRRRVAVKRVPTENVNDREEIALNKLMNHPNVIKLFHTEKNEDFKFYALELCAASMYDIFLPDDASPKKYKGPLPSDLDVLLQLSEGLHYIHENGFVHRDVKPENVLISYPEDDGTVLMKWADFGLSKSVSLRGTYLISGVRGTMNWIAPEILAILGDGQSSMELRGTVESDTWSSGCVFFKYLTKGKHPFGENSLEIVANMQNLNPVNLPALPSDHLAYNIIKEMIKKEPAERIKLIKVVKILKEVKEETKQRQHQEPNVRYEMESDQLYSWEQWNLILKNGELFAWSEDVAIEGITRTSEGSTVRIKLNESADKKKINDYRIGIPLGTGPRLISSLIFVELLSDGFKLEVRRKEEDLNREMLHAVGIKPGTPSRSLPNSHFALNGTQWTVHPSSSPLLGDTITVKKNGDPDGELVLFGASFPSIFHITWKDGRKTIVFMTNRAKLAVENELLNLCSRPILERKDLKELDRIAALLQARVDPNCTNTDGQTPLLLCLGNQSGEPRLKCLKILLEGSNNISAGKERSKRRKKNRFERQRSSTEKRILLYAEGQRPDGL